MKCILKDPNWCEKHFREENAQTANNILILGDNTFYLWKDLKLFDWIIFQKLEIISGAIIAIV